MKNNTEKIYDITHYDRPSVAADIVVFTTRRNEVESYRHLSEQKLSVLLVKRTEDPYKGVMSLPGGFCCKEETIEETAERKLKEKTGISDLPLSLLCNLSKYGRDPRGWIISCCYWTLIEYSNSKIEKTAAWYDVDLSEEKDGLYTLILTGDNGEILKSVVLTEDSRELYNQSSVSKIIESGGLAFDHAGIIVNALLQLRASLEKPYAAFRMLPEKFTLTELQQVYEVILDKKLLMANFRRKTASYVEETGESESGAGHRPSKLFRAKKKNELSDN